MAKGDLGIIKLLKTIKKLEAGLAASIGDDKETINEAK